MKSVVDSDAPRRSSSVLNPEYPSSWWAVGFSDELKPGEMVPVKVLERDLILWRDTTRRLHIQSAICPHLGANIGYGGEVVGDTVQCPFHGYRYDGSGAVCERVGEDSRTPARLALRTYTVQEDHGTIFVWNGDDPPDHEVPNFAAIFPDRPDWTSDDISYFHYAFVFPFPAKWFIENIPDANHFSALHRVCEWGEPEIIEDSSHTFRVNLRLKKPKPFMTLANFREHARLGQLTNPVAAGGDLEMTTYGGGVHVVALAPRVDGGGRIGELLSLLDSSRAIACWTPMTADSHVNRYIYLLPRIGSSRLNRALKPILRRVLVARAWAAIVQDISVMRYRQEPSNPVYGKLDRGLVRFRRFWDSRILDRSQWIGDNMHSNGMRAGIRWDDRPDPVARDSNEDDRVAQGAEGRGAFGV